VRPAVAAHRRQQNICELVSTSATSAHGRAVASGWLNVSFSSAVGSISGIRLSCTAFRTILFRIPRVAYHY
jgi:hypothetical protein